MPTERYTEIIRKLQKLREQERQGTLSPQEIIIIRKIFKLLSVLILSQKKPVSKNIIFHEKCWPDRKSIFPHKSCFDGLSGDTLITVTEAAEFACVNKGTISKHIKSGEIKSNGKKWHKRRVYKSTVLWWMHKKEDKKSRREPWKDNEKLDYIQEQP